MLHQFRCMCLWGNSLFLLTPREFLVCVYTDINRRCSKSWFVNQSEAETVQRYEVIYWFLLYCVYAHKDGCGNSIRLTLCPNLQPLYRYTNVISKAMYYKRSFAHKIILYQERNNWNTLLPIKNNQYVHSLNTALFQTVKRSISLYASNKK